MKKLDLRIPLDLSGFEGEESELNLGFELTSDEKKSFHNVIDFKDLNIQGFLSGASDLYTVKLVCSGQVKVLDAHDPKRVDEIDLDDETEITIDPHDEENSDVQADKDGVYDLRSSIIALLFDAIPKNYSEIPLKKIVTEDYTLLSESEHDNEKNRLSNPFSDLDSGEFEDQKTVKKTAKKKVVKKTAKK
ncbi:MAG: hypothetical protein WCR56_03125 [Bacilli bacterium]|jgi:hypothetical protein